MYAHETYLCTWGAYMHKWMRMCIHEDISMHMCIHENIHMHMCIHEDIHMQISSCMHMRHTYANVCTFQIVLSSPYSPHKAVDGSLKRGSVEKNDLCNSTYRFQFICCRAHMEKFFFLHLSTYAVATCGRFFTWYLPHCTYSVLWIRLEFK